MRSRLAALGVAALFLIAFGPLGAAQNDDGEARQIEYADIAQRHGLQQAFPGGPSAQPAPPPRSIAIPRSSVNISNILLALLVIGIILAFVYFIITNVRAYRRQTDRFREAQTATEPVEVWGTVPDDSWDALLNRLRLSGDMNAAIHEMLLAAIGFCQQELSIHIPRAKTPREIHQALPPGFAAEDAFETLVQGAELAWFGAKPVDPPMFHRGLDALERIIRLKANG